MTVLFLDCDGVINRFRTMPNGFAGFIPGFLVDADCVANLNAVLDRTDCRLVVISAWRNLVHAGRMTLSEFEKHLTDRGVRCDGKVIGVTRPDASSGVSDRGRQVTEWLAGHAVSRYAVVDDQAFDIAECDHPFVRTDPMWGLTIPDAERLIDMLGPAA